MNSSERKQFALENLEAELIEALAQTVKNFKRRKSFKSLLNKGSYEFGIGKCYTLAYHPYRRKNDITMRS